MDGREGLQRPGGIIDPTKAQKELAHKDPHGLLSPGKPGLKGDKAGFPRSQQSGIARRGWRAGHDGKILDIGKPLVVLVVVTGLAGLFAGVAHQGTRENRILPAQGMERTRAMAVLTLDVLESDRLGSRRSGEPARLTPAHGMALDAFDIDLLVS